VISKPTSQFYGAKRQTPEPSFPSGITPAGDGEWLGKRLQKKDYTKLDRAMGYALSKEPDLELPNSKNRKKVKDTVDEKVNSTGNPNRGTRGPRRGGRGRDQNSRQGRHDLRNGHGIYGSRMLMASISKNHQGKENKESGSMSNELMPSLDPDLCTKTNTSDSKFQGRDVNSNQAPFRSIINDDRTPVRGNQGSTFGIAAASSTPSSSAIAPHQMGYKNYKNTCYMLAPVQVLQGIPSLVSSSLPLVNLVEEWEDNLTILDNISGDIKASRLALPWSLLCRARQKGDSVAATTQVQELKSAMGEVSESFRGSSMQDAHEFAAQFIDNLKEGVAKMEEEVEQGKKEGRVNPVVDNLEMEWEETLVCERCGVRTVRRKKEVGLFCSLKEDSSPINLRELIESSVEPEVVERNCEERGCKHNQARQSRRLTAMPRVLLIYLKRMAWAVDKGSGEQEGKNIKVTKVVGIPSVVSLAPIKAQDCSLPPAQPLPCSPNQPSFSPVINLLSPVKKAHPTLTPNSVMATPPKFSGKTVDQLAAMSETDQEEYVTFRSTRETLGGVDQNLTEEQQLKAALEASMKEINSPASETAATSYEKDLQETIRLSIQETASPAQRGLATPLKAFPVLPQRRLSTAFESPDKTPAKAPKRQGEREDGSGAGKKCRESDVRRPLTVVEEEEDLRRALELSLASSTPSTPAHKLTPAPGSNAEAAVAGPPKWQYRLHSVVKHLGSSPTAGHYIADVFRFDAGGWWRYDDSQVNQISEERVLGGSGRREGYIFTYVHQPQWDLWTAGLVDS